MADQETEELLSDIPRGPEHADGYPCIIIHSLVKLYIHQHARASPERRAIT
jgi:hypothetical protein